MEICTQKAPEPVEVSPGHWAKCWLHQEGKANLLRQDRIRFGVPAEVAAAEAGLAHADAEDALTRTVATEAETTSDLGPFQP